MTQDIDHYFMSSANAEELWERLHTALAPYGVTAVFYAVSHLPEILSVEHLADILKTDNTSHSFHFKTSFPQELANVNDGHYRIEKDLSALHCLTQTTPFIWNTKSCWALTQSEQATIDEYWYGVKLVGATIPLRFGDFGKGGIGLYMSKLSNNEFDQMWEKNRITVLSIVTKFDKAVRAGFLDLIGIELTKREKDILGFIAQGYSAKIIAGTLGTKVNTVQNQIVSLREKMGARNNVQLVTKAVTFQLI